MRHEGMLVGESAKAGEMVVNIARRSSLGNQRSSAADIAVQLTPPRTFTLEEALEYIMDDELVEVTPKSVRMRKRILTRPSGASGRCAPARSRSSAPRI